MTNPPPSGGPALRLCSFRLGDDWFGIDVLQVQELLQSVPLTEVPLIPPPVMGLINIRGVIVTAVSPKHRLGLADKRYPPDHHLITVICDDQQIALLVDDIGDVLLAEAQHLAPPPPTLSSPLRGLATGVYAREGLLITCLDVAALVSP